MKFPFQIQRLPHKRRGSALFRRIPRRRAQAVSRSPDPCVIRIPALILLLCGFLLAACNTIAPYNQAAYAQAVSAKVDSLVLMDKATGYYSAHAREIAALRIQLRKAYEYEAGRPLNGDTTDEWLILLDPDGDLLGGFLAEWEKDGPLLPTYVADKKDRIAKAFDIIIQTESGKLKN